MTEMVRSDFSKCHLIDVYYTVVINYAILHAGAGGSSYEVLLAKSPLGFRDPKRGLER